MLGHPTLFLYLTRRLALATAVCAAAVTVPVIAVFVLHHVPLSLRTLDLMALAIYGIAPTVFFLAMPIAVGAGVAWTLGHLAAEGCLSAIHTARISPAAIALPVALVGLGWTGAGYVTANLVAPATAKGVHDAIYELRNNLSPRFLSPGRFYEMGDGRYTLRFEDWIDERTVSDIFVRAMEPDGRETVLRARRAEFRQTPDHQFVLLHDGTSQMFSLERGRLQTAEFQDLARELVLGASDRPPQRPWRGVFEYSATEFVSARDWNGRPVWQDAHWASEAVKRFLMPAAALVHALFAAALVMSTPLATGRSRLKPEHLAAGFAPLHVALVVAAEGLVASNPGFGLMLAGLLAAELTVAVALILGWRPAGAPVRIRRVAVRAQPAWPPATAARWRPDRLP